MDRALDLKPEVTQGCGFEYRLWQEVSTTEVRPLSETTNPRLLQVCVHLDGLNAEKHISLLIILCIIVYVTNKAHLSLICNLFAEIKIRNSAKNIFIKSKFNNFGMG